MSPIAYDILMPYQLILLWTCGEWLVYPLWLDHPFTTQVLQFHSSFTCALQDWKSVGVHSRTGRGIQIQRQEVLLQRQKVSRTGSLTSRMGILTCALHISVQWLTIQPPWNSMNDVTFSHSTDYTYMLSPYVQGCPLTVGVSPAPTQNKGSG